jgi:uncharacterized protein YuzE
MRIDYFPDTDSLYIDLSPKPSVESREASPGVVIDYDAEGNIVGIDIDEAMQRLDLSELTVSGLPMEVRRASR